LISANFGVSNFEKALDLGYYTMKIIRDVSGMDICALQEILNSVVPEFADSRVRYMILPQKLGDLEKPEFRNSLRNKIEAIKDMQKRLHEGTLSPDECQFMVMEILSSS